MDDSMPRTRDHEALSDLVAHGLLTVKEIAHATGLATNYLYEFLNHRRNPTPQMFNRMLVYAGRFLTTDRERYVRISQTIVPLFVADTPIQAHVVFDESPKDRPVEDVRRDVGVLCREVGNVADKHNAVFADGKVDRHDAPEVAELNVKIPLLVNNLWAMLRYVNQQLDASGARRSA